MEALIPITFFMSVAAVLILRPVSKKLGGLLEAMTRERAAARGDEQSARMIQLMEQMARRMELMEERLDFTERLVAAPPRRRVDRIGRSGRRDPEGQLQRS